MTEKTCRHCGLDIVFSDAYGGWFHLEPGRAACAPTYAEPVDDEQRPHWQVANDQDTWDNVYTVCDCDINREHTVQGHVHADPHPFSLMHPRQDRPEDPNG